MTYGMNNRSCMLRLPQNRFCIENRAADMCMNPYLSLGMTTAATVAGVTEAIDPGPSLDKDLYQLTDEEIRASGGQRLPRNLLEATEILKDDPLATEVLGPAMLGLLAAVQSRRVGALPPGGHGLGGPGVPQALLSRRSGETRERRTTRCSSSANVEHAPAAPGVLGGHHKVVGKPHELARPPTAGASPPARTTHPAHGAGRRSRASG